MENEKPDIKKMGMGELRNYLCHKSNGNPKVCMNCPGLKTCTAGQRAMVLIHESEIRARPENEIEQFKLACVSGNPWGWLEHTLEINKLQAREKLIGWCKKFPAVTKEYGGQEQIMRYRPYLAQEAAYEAKQEEMPTEEQTAVNAEKTQQELKREKARKLCETAILSGDARQYLLDELKLTSHQASCRVTAWRKNYPDLFEKHNVPPAKIGGYNKYNSSSRKSEAETKTLKEENHAEVPMTNEDEVSLADWLDEMEPKENPVQAELRKKYEELKAEKERIEQEIDEKQKRLVLISDQEDALYKVLEMFK